ncbi:hypothetical protein Pmar_PMAR019520 [Perkinsus marinus ATCC 50983]|uniref:Metallo-beta-lactamase domain-containing protein n=1 Tax=Perkinsus marinus (strain ATCC 50983 / TXsc) TaxID=423536 RepID=C5KR90_PERM5|nr:hypothetical protein Pmar_PMAR019520 [Perkinsus marinus ATCC 50983]EER12991.1 hypothetical protein Pmar_PMAR019520 [Perkinsus marinus ATCC 50983]|eukprot:XP_002781196.1 hypothetical protein Pmar_PMAR019520 [Perkinsus marinus ATCC 50983]
MSNKPPPAACSRGRIEVDVLGAGRSVGRSCVLVTFVPPASSCKPRVRILLDCGANVSCGDPAHHGDEKQHSVVAEHADDDDLDSVGDSSATTPQQLLRSVIRHSLAKHRHRVPMLDRLWPDNSKTGMLPLDAVLVTHFHLDHTGALPYLTEVLMSGQRRSPEIVMSLMTKLTAPMLLRDYAKEQSPPPYYPCHIESCFEKALVMAPGSQRTLTCGAVVTAYPAGHVVGALMFMIEYEGLTLFYTGDFSTQAEFTMPAANLLTRQLPLTGKTIDVVISEATFGSSVHMNSRSKEARLCNIVCGRERLRDYMGSADVPPLITVMPVFATSRVSEMAQMLLAYYKREVLNKDLLESLSTRAGAMSKTYHLPDDFNQKNKRLDDNFGLPSVPDIHFYTLSPVTYMCNEYYRRLSLGLAEGDTSVMGAVAAVTTAARVELIDENFVFLPNCISVVFCGAAMMESGSSLAFFNRESGNPHAQFVLTGYCRKGTVGNELIMVASQAEKRRKNEGGKPPKKRSKWSPVVNFGDGRKVSIQCKPYYIPMTYHTDSYGACQMIAGLRPAKRVILLHSEYKRMKALQELIEFRLGIPVECPENGQHIVIECDGPAPD